MATLCGVLWILERKCCQFQEYQLHRARNPRIVTQITVAVGMDRYVENGRYRWERTSLSVYRPEKT